MPAPAMPPAAFVVPPEMVMSLPLPLTPPPTPAPPSPPAAFVVLPEMVISLPLP